MDAEVLAVVRPPSLSHTAKLVHAHHFLDTVCQTRPLNLNDTTDLESEEVLNYLMETHTQRMSAELILCLAPAHLRNLCLKNCGHLSTKDVARILAKCCFLSVLSLENCCQVNIGVVQQIVQPSMTSLVTLNLCGCVKLKDEAVQGLLRTAKCLQHLSMADTKITDSAFLVDSCIQHRLETCGQTLGEKTEFLAQLTTVNISGCSSFSNDGLLHLCSLSGPTLHSVNVQQTKVNFQGLLFLAGHNRPSAFHLLRGFGCILNSCTSASHSDSCDSDRDTCTSLRTSSESENQRAAGGVASDSRALANFPDAQLNVIEIDQTADQSKLDQVVDVDQVKVSVTGVDEVGTGSHSHTFHSNTLKAEMKPEEQSSSMASANMPVFQPKLTSLAFSANVCSFALVCFEVCLKANASLKEVRMGEGATVLADMSSLFRSSEDACENDVQKDINTHPIGINTVKEVYAELYKMIVSSISRLLPHIQHVAINQEETEWNCLSEESVSDLLVSCTDLLSLDLSGCYALTDRAFWSLQKHKNLDSLNLSPCAISLSTPFFIPCGQPSQLTRLDLSWSEDVEEEGLNEALALCPSLTSLSLRRCPVSNQTLMVLAQHCNVIRQLDISGAEELEDDGIVLLAKALRDLRVLDLSCDAGLSDESIKALMTFCPQLQSVDFSCLPSITSRPFMQIISETGPAALKEEPASRTWLEKSTKQGPVPLKILALARRSTSYGSCLRHVDLGYCNSVAERDMRRVVTVCRGGLTVLNYHKQNVQPYITYC